MTPDFLKNVYLLSAISSVTFGLIGALVVARRIGYLAGAISHCAFGGIGFGLWFQQALKTGALGTLTLAALFTSPENASKLCERWSSFLNPIPTALLFAVLSALLVDAIRRRAKEREETLLGAIWAIGMALGLLFIERVDGYVSVSTYLLATFSSSGEATFGRRRRSAALFCSSFFAILSGSKRSASTKNTPNYAALTSTFKTGFC